MHGYIIEKHPTANRCFLPLPPMIRIGKIAAAHGLKGALVLTHIIGHNKWLKAKDTLFIAMSKDSYIPYFVTAAKAAKQDEYMLQLDDVNTVESARRLVGKHVYVNEEVLEAHAKDSPLMWIGFDITDSQHGKLGIIDDMVLAAVQWLAKVNHDGAEVLIPMIPEIVKQIDLKKKTVLVTMPDGLLEIYTQK
jgi:16S rRNA processing protein RimM